jgi:hypothetical protein
VYKIIICKKSDRKIPLCRPRSKWEDNVKTDFEKICCRIEEFGSGSLPSVVLFLTVQGIMWFQIKCRIS